MSEIQNEYDVMENIRKAHWLNEDVPKTLLSRRDILSGAVKRM